MSVTEEKVSVGSNIGVTLKSGASALAPRTVSTVPVPPASASGSKTQRVKPTPPSNPPGASALGEMEVKIRNMGIATEILKIMHPHELDSRNTRFVMNQVLLNWGMTAVSTRSTRMDGAVHGRGNTAHVSVGKKEDRAKKSKKKKPKSGRTSTTGNTSDGKKASFDKDDEEYSSLTVRIDSLSDEIHSENPSATLDELRNQRKRLCDQRTARKRMLQGK